MSLWKKLFGARPKQPPGLADPHFASFLTGWEYELRSSTTPTEQLLEEMPERFFEHFPDTFDEPTSNRLLLELRAWTERLIADEKAKEETWTSATGNDRLTAAFEALRERELVALEDEGVSIQDGWGGVGLQQRRHHRGAVFYHQQDVVDAIRGEELLLAFGSFDERPAAPPSAAVGHEVVEALRAHGLVASWSGNPDERIRLQPFPWQKRRWTSPPTVGGPPDSSSSEAHLSDKQRFIPTQLAPENAKEFSQRVTAVRSSAGFNVQWSDAFRALWEKHGGARGQLCHIGPPHVFVPAGEQTELGVRNAYLNLDPAEAAAIRRRARRAVIHKERQSVVRATPWERPLWTAGGGPGRVGIIVVADAPLPEIEGDVSPVDQPEWSPYSEVPEGFTCVLRSREAEPERFSSLAATARLAHENTTSGPSKAVIERIDRAQHGAFIHAEITDPKDLGYLQFGWAVARWLLERVDGAVLDTLAGRWWTRDELVSWEAGKWPSGRRFLLQRELNFVSAASDIDDRWVLSTEGLKKFGRPDLLCCIVPEQLDSSGEFAKASIPAWAPEAIDRFANQLALGAHFRPGDTLKLGTLTFTVEECRPGLNAPKEASAEAVVLVAPSTHSKASSDIT